MSQQQPQKPPSRVVFIGNIPCTLIYSYYNSFSSGSTHARDTDDYSETQVIDIFKTVGPVLSFRMVFDRETGKPKGFGFCTYPDPQTAASAVRNLNNYDVGGRQLRVDFADMDESEAQASRSTGGPPGAFKSNNGPPIPQRQNMAQPQQQQQGHQGVDAIQSTMAALAPQQLLEYLSYLKVICPEFLVKKETVLSHWM
jgi:RNA recognition motif-containing protein